MQMSLKEEEQAWIKNFNALEDWLLQYDYLLFQAGNVQKMSEKYKNQKNLVEGCQSKVWIYVWIDHNNVYMMVDSQSLIIKGILAVIKSMIEGKSTAEVLNWTPAFIDTTSVGKQLSVDRRMGVQAILRHIKENIIKEGD